MRRKFLLLIVLFGFFIFHNPVMVRSVKAGSYEANKQQPFQTENITTLNTPWSIKFLPDDRMIITEKPGNMYIVSPTGEKTSVKNVPDVAASGQNGLLDVALSPNFAENSEIFITYVAPSENGTRLVLSKAKLVENSQEVKLDNIENLWVQTPAGGKGQPGGRIVFDSNGKHIFLSVGDRMMPDSAQDPQQARGKIIRLNLDGTVPTNNPHSGKTGVMSMTWSTGHRNPYGLAFDKKQRLWSHEMGPKGGDELNLIEPGKNYGWPLVSNGDNYNGTPIPNHDTKPEYEAPKVYWTPVISPAGLIFYEGNMFPEWKDSAFIGGLSSKALIHIGFDASGNPYEVDRWDMGTRIRDIAVAKDGAIWLIEDSPNGHLIKLTAR